MRVSQCKQNVSSLITLLNNLLHLIELMSMSTNTVRQVQYNLE